MKEGVVPEDWKLANVCLVFKKRSKKHRLSTTDLCNVEKYRDLEIRVRDQSRSLKVVSFNRLGMVFWIVFCR